MFEIIDDLKIKLDHHRPLPPAIVKNLHEYLLLRWIYHSNAIEGNTLTLLETKVVLERITVGGKVLREHFEVINHRDAILYVEDIIKKEEPFSEWQIRNINQLILKNIDDDFSPLTIEEFNSRIDQSLEDSKNDKVIESNKLMAEIKQWQ